MEFVTRIANRNILIKCIYPGISDLCKPYCAEEITTSDIEIHTDKSMILEEAEQSRSPNNLVPDLKGMEWLLLHRLVSEALLSFDTLLMHGAVVAVDNAAYMFTANSGTGKTTHIKSWLQNIHGSYVVNGDKPYIVLRKAGELPLACGSPWAGKEKLQTNIAVPLKAIVLMERSEENHMEVIPFAQAFPFLLQQVYQPKEKEKMQKTLNLMLRLNSAVSFWRFQFNNFKDDCFDVAYNALVKGRNE